MFMTFLLIGVVLLMVEAAIPGFGIFGVTGLFSLLAALFLYLGGGGQALFIVGALLFLTLVLGYWFFHKGPHSRIGRRITLGLRFTADKGYEATERWWDRRERRQRPCAHPDASQSTGSLMTP